MFDNFAKLKSILSNIISISDDAFALLLFALRRRHITITQYKIYEVMNNGGVAALAAAACHYFKRHLDVTTFKIYRHSSVEQHRQLKWTQILFDIVCGCEQWMQSISRLGRSNVPELNLNWNGGEGFEIFQKILMLMQYFMIWIKRKIFSNTCLI